ncbi:MAG: NAD(P)H-dependent oxidoreductase subunit E [Bacillota bacterium]|nr:NAD(P)H-dependent oxidoreductase subunit E [Bacillota bacterium]
MDTFGKITEICLKYGGEESYLIQILLEIQNEFNWLPKEAMLRLQDELHVPLPRLYEIATFYKVFSLIPRGRNLIKVCTGTACHVRKAPVLINRVIQLLRIKPGETTDDLRFSLETVGCLGCCALGPVLLINSEYHSNPTTSQLEKLFSECL